MTDLRVIPGGRSEPAAAVAIYDAGLARRVQQAERDARRIARLLAPAIATTSKPDAELVTMIESARITDAAATATAFAEAAAAARALSNVLHDAEAKIVAAMVAIVGSQMAKPPTT